MRGNAPFPCASEARDLSAPVSPAAEDGRERLGAYRSDYAVRCRVGVMWVDPMTGGRGRLTHVQRGPTRPVRSLGTTRMEGLSDGVFGFAMTLLVVDIAVHPPGTPLEQLLRAWPAYLAYLVSFLTIGAAWLLHVALTDTLTRTDPIFLRLNLLTLLVVVLLPVPTRLVADAAHSSSGERVAVTVYGLTLLSIRLMGFALRAYAHREDLTTGHDANN